MSESELDTIRHILGHCPAKSHICWYSETNDKLKKDFPGDDHTAEMALCHLQEQALTEYMKTKMLEIVGDDEVCNLPKTEENIPGFRAVSIRNNLRAELRAKVKEVYGG